eukprot:5516110-Ditylum_brightwellii.AAC.1
MKQKNQPSSNPLIMTADIRQHFQVIHHPPQGPYHPPDNFSTPTEYYSDQNMPPDTSHRVHLKLDDWLT